MVSFLPEQKLTNCRNARSIGILLMNSNCFARIFKLLLYHNWPPQKAYLGDLHIFCDYTFVLYNQLDSARALKIA